jgi:ribosomal protein L11 methylase PrmA
LISDAEKLGISIDPQQLSRFETLSELLVEQNKTMNLTAITDPDGIAVKHFADSISVLTAAEIPQGSRVLDVGTGSGILSICASKLGAKSCNAYDIDPVAVKVARENAKDDGCDNITVGVSDLLKGVDKSEGKYDFCVANIVSDIIIRMMPDIHGYLKDGAPLILSGIIIDRADEVRASVREHGFTIEREEKENDWVALLCRR